MPVNGRKKCTQVHTHRASFNEAVLFKSAQTPELSRRSMSQMSGKLDRQAALERPAHSQPDGPGDSIAIRQRFVNIVAKSRRMLEMFDLIERVAASDANILIQGESGTGKELIADAIHEGSRRTKPFIKINCAAIPHELLESELFGYTQGSFTGATLDRGGLF